MGEYLSGKAGEILIGEKLAEKLEVTIGDKLVAVANDQSGSVTNQLFRVTGIYRTNNSGFDKTHAFVNFDDAQNMLMLNGAITSIAIVCNNRDEIQAKKEQLAIALGNQYEVFSYPEMLPLAMSFIEMYNKSIYIYYFIIILAVFFGVVNTMLMSVYERVQEIGVLMAIGMKRSKIFMMILLEAMSLGVVGTVIGCILSLILYIPLSRTGIDLSAFSAGMTSMGIGSQMYAVLDITIILNALLLMPIGTMIGAVYPAQKAIRLHATDAMRYV
jgi:ABC-type lipoprotein release transport system permease subunit